MFSYFVLWIPVVQKGDLKVITPSLDAVILKDVPEAEEMYIKGCINPNTFHITFEYWFQNEDRHTYTFECIEKKNTGFIVYRVNIEDDATDFVSESLKYGFHKSYYHYIKGFFHSHVHHDKGEDSLLTCYFSQDAVSLNNKQTLKSVVDSYLDCYIQKLTGNVSEIQNHLSDLLEEMSQGKNVTKHIKFIHQLIKNCYCIKGELGYCRFLSDMNVNNSSREKRRELNVACADFNSSMDELLFWYNHYVSLVSYTAGGKSLKWGIAGAVLGITSLVTTAVLEYRHSRQLTNEKQFEKIDSLNKKQFELIDSLTQKQITHFDDKIDSLSVAIKQIKKQHNKTSAAKKVK